MAPLSKTAFWNDSAADLLADLRASSDGLSMEEGERRLAVYGPNEVSPDKRKPVWERFLVRFGNPLVIILLIASALSAATGDLASFIIVVTIVVLSVLMDFVQELRAQNAVDALRKQVALCAQVIRDGQEITLVVGRLVPGDVVRLSVGDLVPADGRILAARNFFVNQAPLTGEPYPVEKQVSDFAVPVDGLNEAVNAGFAGTYVISGSATLLVCLTGRATILGQLADSLIAKPPPSAFEKGLRQFSNLILRITMLLLVLVLVEGMLFHRPWLESLMFALALAVGLTPEMLPMIITVTLAHGAVRLSRQRVIVKHLGAIHNLGAMDVLCTDKTGTLTEACIRLTRHLDASGAESERVFELAYLNSHFVTGVKSALDQAILDHDECDVIGWRKLDEVPFDFERRRVSVLLERDGQRILIVKGAPEDILRLSTSVETADGGAQALSATLREEIDTRFQLLGAEGFRALAIANRPVGLDHLTAVVTDESELVFAGFAVFLDPPKASAASAIRSLTNSGVAVKVLTGDNERVACHLRGELGFPPMEVMTGEELSATSDEALIGRLPRVNMFCRVTPQQKLRVLLALKRASQTVGFLGDGINDAPALHSADVGISVDDGADVAKAAAEIVLLEKDLAVLHDSVIEGRRTVVNIDKYILMASSANFGNIVTMVIAGLFLPFLPLLPIQVLLTNLVYDFAQVGLPGDRVDPEAVAQPVHWDIRFIERFMLTLAPVSCLFDFITFGVLIFVFHAPEPLFRTGWFIESLVTQILMIFSVRTHRHLIASRPHRLVASLAVGTSALTIGLPLLPMGRWFQFVPPPAAYFAFLLFAVAAFLLVIEPVKRALYTYKARVGAPASIAGTPSPQQSFPDG
jgi:P-type Mg2+ transporter